MHTGTFIVALESGRIVGAVFVDRHEAVGHYAMLAIEPARQKAGIGCTLMTAAEDWCRAAGCRTVEIEVVNLREELPPFYRRFGYVETGPRPFPEHFDATRPCHFVVWTRPLT
jgi:GNAT superfamily N-acetyltransferase